MYTLTGIWCNNESEKCMNIRWQSPNIVIFMPSINFTYKKQRIPSWMWWLTEIAKETTDCSWRLSCCGTKVCCPIFFTMIRIRSQRSQECYILFGLISFWAFSFVFFFFFHRLKPIIIVKRNKNIFTYCIQKQSSWHTTIKTVD